mgnify:CR=1 FL=1
MQYNTEFYKLLRQAVYDDTALVRVLDKIMKLINSNSKDDDGEINEDLKSELITYSIELIRNKKIYKKFEIWCPLFRFFCAVHRKKKKKLLLWYAHWKLNRFY